MLIRNLNTRSDKRKEEKKQDETLRLAIANDANISSARKNAQLGILTPLSEPQQFTASQLSEDLLTNESKARDKLLETFSLQEANSIIKILSPEQIKFLNIFWKDIKQETMKGDVKLIDSKLFKSILESYINRTLAQKGLGDRVDINEPDEMREIIPSQSLIKRVIQEVSSLDASVREELEQINSVLPNKKVYEKLGQLSDADAEGYVSKLMKAYRNVADVKEWMEVLKNERGKTLITKIKPLYQDFSLIKQRRALLLIRELLKEKETPEPEQEDLISFGEEIKPEEQSVKGQPRPPIKSVKRAEEARERLKKDTEEKAQGKKEYPAQDYKDLFVPKNKTDKDTIIRDIWGNLKGTPELKKVFREMKQAYWIELKPDTPDIVSWFSDNQDLVDQHRARVGRGLKKTSNMKKGKGIVKNTITIAEPLTRWSLFGKLKFNNRLLDEKQIFSVKYPCSTGIHPSFKKAVPVSDTFHELITHLADTQKIDKRILKDLENDEKDLFETFIIKSGMGRKYNLMEKSKKETEDLEERYKVIKGSYLAGNNSNEIKDELKKLINHFINEGKIEKQQGLKVIQNII